ncbi:hypothetical protein [Paenibacillus fonticola]|uniref:hypothetical protein n=1 Tax=Paenibacillus fonticola TaxID=379896 RepID=UPI00035C97DA|nr:hypothetical protein [Paenibacillus fonticola]
MRQIASLRGISSQGREELAARDWWRKGKSDDLWRKVGATYGEPRRLVAMTCEAAMGSGKSSDDHCGELQWGVAKVATITAESCNGEWRR